MREFNDFEKRVLKIIANTDNSSFTEQNFKTLVTQVFEDIKMGIKISSDNEIIIIALLEGFSDINKMNIIFDNLVSIQVLFEYLENLFLIRFYDYSIKGTSMSCPMEGARLQRVIHDENINRFYCKHWTHRFYVTEALRTFVLINDFKTDEQIRFQKEQMDAQRRFEEEQANTQTRFEKQEVDNQREFQLQIKESKKQTQYSKKAYYIALGALIVAIIVPWITNIKLNKEQFCEIKQSIEASKIEIPTKINTVITNDTLRVDIVKFSPQKLVIKEKD